MGFRIAHISDLHLPPLPAVTLKQLLNKRLLGYLSWHRKRKHRHRPEVITALEADLRERESDHICITGDVTNLGLPDEFAAVDRWLHALGPPDAISLIPGNHDIYAASSRAAMRQCLGRWLPAAFPSAARSGPVMFISLSTAVPTPPLLATGRLGKAQLERLDTLLEETRDEGLYRVLLIHHPPAQGVVGSRKSLTDADALTRVLHKKPVDLILHGHGHRPVRYELPCDSQPIPVLGAGSASLSNPDPARSGHYHLIDLDGDRLRVSHRQYLAHQERFATLRQESLDSGELRRRRATR